MTKELFIEVGVEELPAIPFLKELPFIVDKWNGILDEYGLGCEFEFYYTPRRLVFLHNKFALKQKDSIQEFIGAPKHVALKDGEYTKAAHSFAKKCDISVDSLKFKEIDGKEVLYFEKEVIGCESKKLIPEMIEKFLTKLNFGKSMRWGTGEFEFIRPIRSFLVILGDEFLDFNRFGVSSGKSTYPHRSIGYDRLPISSIEDYFSGLDFRGIVLSANKRREIILSQFKELEDKNGFSIQIDDDLLDEVVAITEHPTSLCGSFEEEFLNVPHEAIITSMKENQRYFPVFKNNELTNKFIVVSNAITDDNELIIKGNEKVLRARLSDAKFFFESDLSAEFSDEKLKKIIYLKELGTMHQKVLREKDIGLTLANLYSDELYKEVGDSYKEKIQRAITLSKADLTTQMVYEFTELQGIMGYYYAKAKGEPLEIANAIRQQYLPDGENSSCPDGIFSSIISMSNKLDTLVGLFSVGKIPSGKKDPYALRRAANGIIKIVLNLNINFDISKILLEISTGYKSFDVLTLENFILDRLYTFFDVNPSIIKACVNSGQRDINILCSCIKALESISNKPNFKDNFSTFKRLANIIKDTKITAVNESILKEKSEIELHKSFRNLKLSNDYESRLNELFSLKNIIDDFFDSVMINVDDEKIKTNRLALIGQIYIEFLKIADIKEITL